MSGGLSVLFETFWKSSVALGVPLCVNLLLRNKSAALRRLVLSTAIVAMFASAVMLPVVPRWSATAPSWLQPENPRPVLISGPATIDKVPARVTPTRLRVTHPMASQSDFVRPVPIPRSIPTSSIPAIWFTGTAILLARFAINLLALRRLRRNSVPVTDRDFLGHRIALLQNEAIAAPVTWGIMRPVILVPPRFRQLTVESRQTVLRHEVAHIEAHDFLLRVLAEIARAAIWFQPLMWIASRQLRVEQELACDNRVLAEGARPSAYAKLLLEWDRYVDGNNSPIAVGMVQRSSLRRRLHSLLDDNVQRVPVSRAGILTTALLVLMVAVPLAALQFITTAPRMQPSRTDIAAPLPDLSTAGLPAPGLPTAPLEIAQVRVPEPPPAVKPKSPGAVVILVLDRSASMEGPKIALVRAAATVVVDSLRPDDQIGILTFDQSFEWTVPIRRADDKASLKQLIAGITNNGGTLIPAALREAYEKILPYNAAHRHIVLLTDGISEERDSEATAQDAAAHQITISTIGLGPDVVRPFLEKIAAAAAGNSYFLSTPVGLEEIMLRDVSAHTGAMNPGNR